MLQENSIGSLNRIFNKPPWNDLQEFPVTPDTSEELLVAERPTSRRRGYTRAAGLLPEPKLGLLVFTLFVLEVEIQSTEHFDWTLETIRGEVKVKYHLITSYYSNYSIPNKFLTFFDLHN